MQDIARTHLLIIDPQNDFCDIPERDLPPDPLHPGARLGPALPVPGADADMRRLAAFLHRTGGRLGAIHVTLDSHHPLHIANPGWWIGADGRAPQPFTPVSAADVRSGRWRARNPAAQAHTLAYVERLEASARYTLVIWPEHCLIGHWGHNVHPAVAAGLDAWERERLAPVDYVMKGSNPGTEHYSAARAEVPDPSDPGTLLNRRLVADLQAAESVVIAGEALSHCVANTVRDVADAMGETGVRKLVLLRDCTSPVTGFEALGESFLHDMTARGMRLASSAELMPS
jgi:nicotinamidase-related amidase